MQLLTIIITLYNDCGTLTSFHEQLTKDMKNINYECIFVDNGSHDASLRILRDICEHDYHCNFIALKHNISMYEAYYIGTSHAQGDYILFTDVLHPSYVVAKLFNAMTYNHAKQAGGKLLQQTNQLNDGKQRHFKIFRAKDILPFIDDHDFDSFTSFITSMRDEDVYWVSYNNLEEIKYSRLHLLFLELNHHYGKRMVYLFFIILFITIVVLPLLLIIHYGLGFTYCFYFSFVITLCSIVLLLVLHARLRNFHASKQRGKIKQTTYR